MARLAPSPANGDMTWAASPSRVTPGTRGHECPGGSALTRRAVSGVSASVIIPRSAPDQPASDGRPGRRVIGEVDRVDPVLGHPEAEVDVQAAVGLAVAQQAGLAPQ